MFSALSIVVANMVGTGIFTSLGFQVMDLRTGFSLLSLWMTGGLTALAGALVYAELGTLMPRSGGEYHFLSKIYHPALGFVSGWISFVVGFTAATAAAAIALGSYFSAALGIPSPGEGFSAASIIALAMIIALSILHARSKPAGALFQNIFTGIKVLTLIAFILIGFFNPPQSQISFAPGPGAAREIISAPFAIALFFVSFAYSGWNAAAYIGGEISNPSRNIPLSLVPATLLVTLLYMGITWAFLRLIPIEMMQGRIEIGYIFARQALGHNAGRILGVVFGILLLSNVSSLIITGPRVTQVMGEDYRGIRWFAAKSGNDTPARAIYLQGLVAIIYLLTSTFEQMITYIGFTLNLMTALTVLGMMLLRSRRGKGYRSPFKVRAYPLLPLFFLGINTWIMVYGLIYRPLESLGGLLTAVSGLGIWFILRKGSVRPRVGN